MGQHKSLETNVGTTKGVGENGKRKRRREKPREGEKRE